MMKVAQASQIGVLRPKRSAVRPAMIAPIKAPPEVREVTSSCSLELRMCPSEVPMETKTDEM